MDWKKHSKWWVIGAAAAVILINAWAIYNEHLFIPFFSVAAIIAYLLLFRVDLAMYLMAFSTPFSIGLDTEKVQFNISLPAELLMISLTFLFLARICYDLRFKKNVLKHPVTIAILCYLTWMFICCITSEIPLVSFKFWAAKIWFVCSSFFMVIHLMDKDRSRWITYFNCYAIALGCVVVITTIKNAQVGFGEHIAHWIMNPFYNDHTAYGAVLALFLPMTIGLLFLPETKRGMRVLYGILIAIFLLGTYLSFCRAAWLSLIGALGIWCVVKLRIKFSWFIAGVVVVGTLLFAFSDDILYKMSRNSQDSSTNFAEHLQSISNIKTDASNVERLNRWHSAFAMIEERPVMGWGPGCYQFCYAPYQDSRYHTIITTDFGDGGNAHSEYIGPTAETGFVGLFTVLALVMLVLYYGFRTYQRSHDKSVRRLSLAATLSLITYFIHGVMNNFLDTDKLSLPYWGLFALIVVLSAETESKEARSLEASTPKGIADKEDSHPSSDLTPASAE